MKGKAWHSIPMTADLVIYYFLKSQSRKRSLPFLSGTLSHLRQADEEGYKGEKRQKGLETLSKQGPCSLQEEVQGYRALQSRKGYWTEPRSQPDRSCSLYTWGWRRHNNRCPVKKKKKKKQKRVSN